MRFLRLVVAGLIAIAAMVGVLLAALVVFFTGVAAYVIQLFRKHPAPAPSGPPPDRRTTMRTDDAIDVVSTKVPEEPVKR
jgi:hypothetical protein